MPMSPEERQMLTQLFERVRSQAGAPREQDAEALIADAVRAQPYAPYLLAQAVLVQEQALKGADQKIRELESRVAQAEQAAQSAQAAQEQPRSGGFLGGLFGGGAPRQDPPSPWGQANQNQPAPPPQGGPWGQQGQPPQPGPWGAPQAQGGGNTFLKGALGAAAGVAGGVLLADTLKGVFGGGHGGGGLGAGGLGNAGLGGSSSGGGGETIVNNYYGDDQRGGQDDGYQQADYDDGGGDSGDDNYEA